MLEFYYFRPTAIFTNAWTIFSLNEVQAAGLCLLDLNDYFANNGSSGLFLHPWIERRISFASSDFKILDPIRSTVSVMPDSEETDFLESSPDRFVFNKLWEG